MADLTTTAAEHLSQGVEGSEDFVAQVAQWSDTIDTASLTGLLPVAIAMLILHEMYYATSDNRAPRVWWMFLRIVGFGACLAGYDRVVGMLTGLVGGGNWPEPGDLIAPLDYALQAQLRQLDAVDMGNFGELGLEFFIWAMLFAIDCMLALLAFIIVTVMMKGQALALIIFIAAGKTCLILSIMPGVGIAKSWAKVVATVAAWSFMAQIVFSAVGVANPALANWAGSTSVTAHMQIWLAYGMLAVFTASIPKLVGSLVSGGMSAAPGLGMAIGGAIMGAKMMSPGSPNIRGRAQSLNEKGGELAGKAISRTGGKVARTAGNAERAAGIAMYGAGQASANRISSAVGRMRGEPPIPKAKASTSPANPAQTPSTKSGGGGSSGSVTRGASASAPDASGRPTPGTEVSPAATQASRSSSTSEPTKRGALAPQPSPGANPASTPSPDGGGGGNATPRTSAFPQSSTRQTNQSSKGSNGASSPDVAANRDASASSPQAPTRSASEVHAADSPRSSNASSQNAKVSGNHGAAQRSEESLELPGNRDDEDTTPPSSPRRGGKQER